MIILTVAPALLGPLIAFSVSGSWALTRGLPRWYLLPFGFERWRCGRCYRWLGVRWFKYWLPWSGDWIARRTGRHPLRQGKRQAMFDKAFQNTILYELIHLCILFTPAIPIVLMMQRQAWGAVFVLLAMQLVINVYPIMVQRYNRARLLPLVSLRVKKRWGIPREW